MGQSINSENKLSLDRQEPLYKSRWIYSYPVSDLKAEDAYWDQAVTTAETTNVPFDRSEFKNNKFIKVRDESPDWEYAADCSTTIVVYTNSEKSAYRFELIQFDIDPWWGDETFLGGAITKEQFMIYMNRIGNHDFDNL